MGQLAVIEEGGEPPFKALGPKSRKFAFIQFKNNRSTQQQPGCRFS